MVSELSLAESSISNEEIESILQKLKKREISIFSIPQESSNNLQIVKLERKLGLRQINRCGYDVLSDCFFVEETLKEHMHKCDTTFRTSDFSVFYAFVDGKVYKNACFAYCPNLVALSQNFNLNIKRLTKLKAFEVRKLRDTTVKLSKRAQKYSVIKKEALSNNSFCVTLMWKSSSKGAYKKETFRFDYFFDFVYFLDGDLSNADLIRCDGLMNLQTWDTINFTNCKMTSKASSKFGLKIVPWKPEPSLMMILDQSDEYAALPVNTSSSQIAQCELPVFRDPRAYTSRFYYITDLHLLHYLKKADCISLEDCIYEIHNIVAEIKHDLMRDNNSNKVLLVGGDISSDFEIYKLFVSILSSKIYNRVFFVLGNHEFWSFPGRTIDEIAEIYGSILTQGNLQLLNSDMFYEDGYGEGFVITGRELLEMDSRNIEDRLRCARFVIFGGSGYSGYCSNFNASHGIYKDTITRENEIEETLRFEQLYCKLLPILQRKNAVILSHMPKADWCSNCLPDKHLVYVNGHTHKNKFFDDGLYRLYADNQKGYHANDFHLMSFLLNNNYDYFDSYADGIYVITREEYMDFYRGKNIRMHCFREIHELLMLKKNGIYCFIQRSEQGQLAILHGGSPKNLQYRSIEYYFNNLDLMVNAIKKPLASFSETLINISGIVRQLGGSGRIHGCIIDIDWFNHIYINPFNLTITGYWAADIIDKVVYPSVPALLKAHCPAMYENYKKIASCSEDPFALEIANTALQEPNYYPKTDIYGPSKQIMKMQRLESNILTIWSESLLNQYKETHNEAKNYLCT